MHDTVFFDKAPHVIVLSKKPDWRLTQTQIKRASDMLSKEEETIIMEDIQLRTATLDDCVLLAEMNAQLILDENSQNTMTHAQLADRMHAWLSGTREAIVVQRGSEPIGYMIFWRRNDEYYPYQDSIYIRQFFIQPSYRRRGIGQVVFDRIVNMYFPEEAAITLDVLESNGEAKAFWEKLGFNDYHTTMRRAP